MNPTSIIARLLAPLAFLTNSSGRTREAPIAWIEPDALQHRLAAGDDITILDVRNPDEFAGDLGHINGARNLPLNELTDRLDELRALARQDIAVVCLTDKRSVSAAEALRAHDFAAVTVMRGGMKEWTARGFDSVRGD